MGERDEILGLEVAELYDWLQGLVRQHGIGRAAFDGALARADRGGVARWLAQHGTDAMDALWRSEEQQGSWLRRRLCATAKKICEIESQTKVPSCALSEGVPGVRFFTSP